MPLANLPPLSVPVPVSLTLGVEEFYDTWEKLYGVPEQHSMGNKGAGEIVGICDTGRSHNPYLKNDYKAGSSYVEGETIDENGHSSMISYLYRHAMPDCELVACKVLNNRGSGSTDDIAKGIRWCVAQGCTIINLSLGGGKDPAVDREIVAAIEAGCLVFIASGNSYGRVEEPAASAKLAGVIGACTVAGLRSDFSCYGPQIDGVAIGESVTGCRWNEGFQQQDGTSFATPIMGCMAGLVRSGQRMATKAGRKIIDPVADMASFLRYMEKHLTDVGIKGRDDETGFGVPSKAFVSAGIGEGSAPVPAGDIRSVTWGKFRFNSPARGGEPVGIERAA